MNSVFLRPAIKGTIVALCLSLLTGSVRPTQLEMVKMTGELVVVTRNSPTTYYEDRNGATGYDYELAKAFAQSLGAELKVIVADNTADVFSTLERGDAAFAAAGLTRTPERERRMRFTSAYKEVDELVIYKRGNLNANIPADLANGRVMVSSSSSHAELLRQWQQEQAPALSWSESSDVDVADLMQQLNNGVLDFTLVDSDQFRLLHAYFPSLDIAFKASGKRKMAWAFAYSRDDSLYHAAQEFLKNIKNSAFLAELDERFYGHLSNMDYVDAQHFLRQTNQKLDRYRNFFVTAADQHDFDWRLLAAMSYQESHWNPKAKSFTGVRGLMMLTKKTASELGVNNRLDPQQSINGGTEYLAKLRQRLSDVAEPDRTWLALAAYNVGFGHLSDARRITEKLGGNPNLWVDVKESLPLLSQKQYYRYTRHGYARGQEPVTYVQNIRRYHDVLVWNDEQGRHTDPEADLILSANVTVVPPLL